MMDSHRDFRRALGSFATGVTIVTTVDADGSPVGLTVSSFNSVSLEPPLILWSLDRAARSMAAFMTAEHFIVHVLAADQSELSNTFARPDGDRFAGVETVDGAGGVPRLVDCVAVFECRTKHQYDGGDHVIFVGEVLAFQSAERPPLIFHGGRYAALAPGE